MKFSRGTLAGALIALVAGGAVMMAPLPASARITLPVVDLQATLVSAQPTVATAGIATYHASPTSVAREFKVHLTHISATVAPIVLRVYVNGTFLATMPVSSTGTASLDMTAAPVMQLGQVVKVTTVSPVTNINRVLCVGTLRLTNHTGGRRPSPDNR